MIIIDKLKTLGVEITPEIEKALAGDYVSSIEAEKKQKKIDELKQENETLTSNQEALEKELNELKENAPDKEAYEDKIKELTQTLEKERNERAQKDEETRLSGIVSDFFEGKTFVNEITKEAIKTQLVTALNSDAARGKSVSDLFDSIVKDADGNLKPNILISEQQQQLAQNRSGIVGSVIHQPNGTKLSMAEIMKLKNQNPELDIEPYLKQYDEITG